VGRIGGYQGFVRPQFLVLGCDPNPGSTDVFSKIWGIERTFNKSAALILPMKDSLMDEEVTFSNQYLELRNMWMLALTPDKGGRDSAICI